MSKIEWTDVTWNPLAGCSVISPGCKRCYAMRLAARLERMGVAKYAGLTDQTKAGAVWNGKINFDDDTLLQPLRWKKPRRIFVNSMSDLFHESVPDKWIDKVFAVMALAPQHVFQILTKRADRMQAYLTGHGTATGRIWARAMQLTALRDLGPKATQDELNKAARCTETWPLPNVWLGVSVEDRDRKQRIDDLRATPAALRFLSLEPLLEDLGEIDLAGIGLVIGGGESGPGARWVPPKAFRSIRDQCAIAHVPYFHKQNGEWIPVYESEGDRGQVTWDAADGGPEGRFEGVRAKTIWFGKDAGPHEDGMARVGKKRAGRLLDGVTHDGMPGRPLMNISRITAPRTLKDWRE